MNAMTEKPVPMVLNADNTTYRYPGQMQWAMSVEDQKRAGLIARVNVSIHPGKAKTNRTAKHHRGQEEGK